MKFRNLKADEIECRVATVTEKGCSLLLYKDARCDQNLLDETVGSFNWQRKHELINGNLFCSVGLYNGERGEWVWKQDVGTESYTEKEKGEASDSFKRACFNWGIGRELYTAPFIWIAAGNVKIEEKNGKYTTYERFKVGEIGYENNRINQLTILNKKGDVVYKYGEPTKESVMIGSVTLEYCLQHAKETITGAEVEALADAAREAKVDPAKIAPAYKKNDLLELTYAQYYTLMGGKYWDYFKKA